MTCHINGILISDGNTNDLYHPFTKMIERASMNANLMPGDYLGSGTIATIAIAAVTIAIAIAIAIAAVGVAVAVSYTHLTLPRKA